MIFYRTPDSPLLHPTQAAAGKGFIQHDVPTDKAGLMAYVNELLSQAPQPPPPVEAAPPRGHQPAPTDCPTCLRTKEAAEAMAGVVDFMTVMRFIDRIDNPSHLKQLAARIEEK